MWSEKVSSGRLLCSPLPQTSSGLVHAVSEFSFSVCCRINETASRAASVFIVPITCWFGLLTSLFHFYISRINRLSN